MTSSGKPPAEFTTNEEDQREAANLQARLKGEHRILSNPSATRLPNVEIASGAHKYVLIRAEFNGDTEYIVTSKRGAHYHRNAAEPMVNKLIGAGYTDVDITGGGRIELNEAARTISIFGFSYGFGRADHSISQRVVQEDERYKDYSVTISNDGY